MSNSLNSPETYKVLTKINMCYWRSERIFFYNNKAECDSSVLYPKKSSDGKLDQRRDIKPHVFKNKFKSELRTKVWLLYH